jgi:hypothetical protein
MRLNVVRGFGPFYWILRDTGKKGVPFVSFGWTRELGGYWRVGRGIQIRVGKYIYQFGLCKKREVPNEEEGVLMVLEGRMMQTTTSEISTWR